MLNDDHLHILSLYRWNNQLLILIVCSLRLLVRC